MALSTASNVTAAGSVGPGCTVPLGQTGHIGQPTGATVNGAAGLGPPTQLFVGSIPNPGGPTPGFNHEFLETAAVCFCHRFLNPFGGGPMSLTTTGSNSQCLVNPCLLHYCRVCNIQLNSCRQAKIHSEGKKHEKRLSYLKFCLESTDSIGTNGTLPSNQAQVAQQQVQTCPVPQPSSATSQPQQSVVPGPSPPTMAPQPVAASVVSSSGAGTIGGTTVYYGQGPPVQTVVSSALPPPQAMAPVPQQQASLQPYQPAYYYQHPAAAQPQHPPNAASVTTSVQPPLSQQPGVPATIAGTLPGAPQGYIYSYPDYTTPPPQVPTMMMVPPIPPPGPHPQHLDPYHQAVPTSVTGGPPVPQPQPLLQTQHGVMSPSLTSGFSGSGADCKSTETSSILSAASYSSGAAPHVNTNYNSHGDHSQYYSNKKGSGGYHHNNNSSHYYNNHATTLDYSNMGSYNGHHSHSHGASSNPSSWSYGSSSNNSSSSSSKNNQSTGTNNHGNLVTGNNSTLQQQFNSKLTGVSSGGHQLTHPNGTNVTNNSNSNSHGTSNNINNNNNSVQLMPVDHVTSSSRNNNKSSAVNGAGQSKDSSHGHGHDRGRSDRAGALAIQLPATVFCETCQIAFPSMAVLENHLKGSRHARRVKSQQAFRQLKDAGTLFRIRGSSASVTDIGMSSGAIRCEVCQVSVNSSHQLQAHLTGHKHRVRAIRRGVKTNQAVLSPSSSLLTSSASVSEMSYQSNGTSRSRSNGLISGSGSGGSGNRRAHSERAYSERAEKNKGKSDNTNNNNNKKKNNVRDSSAITTKENNNNNSKQTAELTNKREQQRSSSGKNNNIKIKNKQDNREANQPTQTKALSRHRSSGCLQSRHCHSTLSLSRARSSSALNRLQSRSMNLLMIQNNNNKNQSNNAVVVKTQSKKEVGGGGDQRKTGSKNSGGSKRNSTKTASGDSSNVSSGCNMKSASSDVLSLASNSETCSSGNPRSDLEDEEDEGVATDATTEGNAPGNGSKTKDIKANSGKTRSKFRENNRAKINKDDKEMAWVRLSNGEVAKRTKLKTRKGGDESSADSRRNDKKNIIPNGTSHHEKQNNKIFKRGFNVNAQEWKPSSRRTSVGNASVKDIPMLDVFLQRLDQRHTNYNSDQASPTSNEQ